MRILIDPGTYGKEISLDGIEELARFTLGALQLPDSTELSISFVADDKIRELNRDYRGIDEPTDVLSFACDSPGDASFGESVPNAEYPYVLGDVIIAPHVAENNARKLGHTLQEEIQVLLVHSMLHLVGYDHQAEEDREQMFARQDEILDSYPDDGLDA